MKAEVEMNKDIYDAITREGDINLDKKLLIEIRLNRCKWIDFSRELNQFSYEGLCNIVQKINLDQIKIMFIFAAILGRTPDLSTVNHYLKYLENNTHKDLIRAVAGSQEAINQRSTISMELFGPKRIHRIKNYIRQLLELLKRKWSIPHV